MLLLCYQSPLGYAAPSERENTVLLEEAFRQIGSEYGVFFNYDRSIVSKVKVNYTAAKYSDVEQALNAVLSQANLKFKIFEQRYVAIYKDNAEGLQSLKKMIEHFQGIVDEKESEYEARKAIKSTPFLTKKSLQEEGIFLKRLVLNVSGKVVDTDGEPLIGVNVMVKGSTTGTSTDFNGQFSLNDVEEQAVLVFSYIGYVTTEMPVAGKSTMNVTLMADVQTLDELVVVGYGSQKKVNLTGAVEVIGQDVLKDRNASSVSQLLIGAAGGFDFSFDKNGYQPGANATVGIRGIGSLNGGAPYVVIDGFPGDMNRLNPEDIESISVLKDAAASAIYGARAPYGVILITTKSGSKEDKLVVNYSGSMNLVTPAKLPGTLDSYTFARVTNEAATNNNAPLYYNESTIDRIIAFQQGDYDYIRSQFPSNFPNDPISDWSALPMDNGSWAGANNGHANNDYWDLATGPNLGQSHNFSIQGGSNKVGYFLSMGYTDQKSSMQWADDFYKRFNLSAKIKTELTDWWDLKYEGRFMKNQRFFPTGSRPETIDSYNALFHIVYNTPPTQPLYNSFGGPIQSTKQFFSAGNNNDQQTENWQILGTELRPATNWKINLDVAYQMMDEYDLHDGQAFSQVNWITGENTTSWYPSQIYEYHFSNYYWSTNAYTSYEWNIAGDHNFLAMAGAQYESAKDRSLNAYARNLIVPDIISLNTATGDPSVREALSQWSTEGYFGRLTYNFQEKYLLETNLRYDGTSKFLDNKRWGFFPSVSGGWVVSKENFWQPVASTINTLKLRGSWGELGNQNVAAYQDLALIQLTKNILDWLPGQDQVGQVGYALTPNLVSPLLTWETAATTNIGVDLEMLNNKLQMNFDWFERNTKDMIGPSETLPGVLGASVPRSNNSSLRTRGWELSLNWKEYVNEDLSYSVGFNLYDSKSVVTKYNNPTGYLGSWREGQDVGEIWGWSADGLFQSQAEIENHVDQSFIYNVWNTGDVKYNDINGDGKIDNGSNTYDDHGDYVLIGNSSPRYQFGINMGVNYKGFDFSMLWKGTGKRQKAMTYNDYGFFGFMRTAWSQPKEDHLDYYRDQPGTQYIGLYEGEANINTDSYYARPYLDINSNLKNQNGNSRYLANYAYIRLQNMQLGYSLSKNALSRLGLSKLRVYIAGNNIITFDHLPDGMDVTLPSGGYRESTGKEYRADRIYSFGVNISY
ncbi:TonB-dependent receptor [Membranihabitans marinus]